MNRFAARAIAHGGGDAEAEEAEEAAAVGGAFQIADGVQGGEQPEHGGEDDEEQPQGVGLERQVQSRQHFEAHPVSIPRPYADEQHEDQHQFGDGTEQVEDGAQGDALLGQGEDHQPRQ